MKKEQGQVVRLPPLEEEKKGEKMVVVIP